MPRHVRKGDTVMVTSGSSKGQVGEIMRVLTKFDKVLVKGINLQTKHLRPTRESPQGGIITKEMPLHISKVSPVVDGKAVRVGFRTDADGSKVRIARHAGKELKVLGIVHQARDGKGAVITKPAPAPKPSVKPEAAPAKPKSVKPKATKAGAAASTEKKPAKAAKAKSAK